MAAHRRINVNEIHEKLQRYALHYGARKNRLYKHGRELIDLLIPDDDTTDDGYSLRAIRAERLIRLAISLLNPPDSEALRICLALRGEGIALGPLERRRQEAAQLYDVLPHTFRLRYESALLFDLAFQIYSLLIGADRPASPEYCPDIAENPYYREEGA